MEKLTEKQIKEIKRLTKIRKRLGLVSAFNLFVGLLGLTFSESYGMLFLSVVNLLISLYLFSVREMTVWLIDFEKNFGDNDSFN